MCWLRGFTFLEFAVRPAWKAFELTFPVLQNTRSYEVEEELQWLAIFVKQPFSLIRMHLNARQPWCQDHDYSSMPLPSPPRSSPTPSTTSLPFPMPPSPSTTHNNPTSTHLLTPLDLLCPQSQEQAVSNLNGFPAHPALPGHLSLPTHPIPQHCLPSEALTLPHPPPRLAEMVCNIADFSNMITEAEGNSIEDATNNIDRQPSPCRAPSPPSPATSPEAIASSTIAELSELTDLEPAPAWAGPWEPEQQDILSSAMAALSDMLDSSAECNSALEYNCNYVPTSSSSSFGYNNSPSALGNFHSSSTSSYNYPSQTDTGCYGMKAESDMYGLKTEVCYGAGLVKTEAESYGASPKQSYGDLSTSTSTTSLKENFGGELNLKGSYGLSPTSVLDYGSPPSSPSSADGWPMGKCVIFTFFKHE